MTFITNPPVRLGVSPSDAPARILVGSRPETTSGLPRYFDSFETVTTGASPVNIDPTVFHTRITTGGTGGIEIINFPDYTPSQSGKPHLVTMVTRTNPADKIHVQGATAILGSPFSSAVVLNDYVPEIFNPTLMELNGVGQGFVLTWMDFAWQVTGLVQEPTITYPNASYESGGNIAPSVLFQTADGKYDMLSDMANPSFQMEYIASSNIANPTAIFPGTRSIVVHSTGLGGPGYFRLGGPDTTFGNVATTGCQLTLLGDLVNGADTLLIPSANLVSSVRNADGSTLTTFQLDSAMAVMHWDNVWILDPPTNCTVVPPVLGVIYGRHYPPYNVTRNAPFTYNVTKSDNFCTFSNNGIGLGTFNLPVASQTGYEYTFINALTGTGNTTVVKALTGTTIYGPGVQTSSGGTLTSTQAGATITVRDIASPAFVVTAFTGTWVYA